MTQAHGDASHRANPKSENHDSLARVRAAAQELHAATGDAAAMRGEAMKESLQAIPKMATAVTASVKESLDEQGEATAKHLEEAIKDLEATEKSVAESLKATGSALEASVRRENARVLAIASRGPIAGESRVEVRQRAEGEFLRKLVTELQPMLRESMRSHRIRLASDADGTVALKSDGIFVHVGIADQEDVLVPLQVLQAEPSLIRVLDRIEAELVAADDPRAIRAADIVRFARDSLEVVAAT
jgi:hypothetical protein